MQIGRNRMMKLPECYEKQHGHHWRDEFKQRTKGSPDLWIQTMMETLKIKVE